MAFTMYEYRDLDLLGKLRELGDISARDLAVELGHEENGTTLASRLSWMRRFGMLHYDEKRSLWRITDGADRVLAAKGQAARQSTLEAIPEEALVDVMAHVSARYRLGDPMIAQMLRREFVYGTSPRR